MDIKKTLRITAWKTSSALSKIFFPFCLYISGRFPFLKKWFKKKLYHAAAKEIKSEPGLFGLMNYGYAYDSPEDFPIKLDPSDHNEFRFSWQLVYEVVKNVKLSGKKVLVVGCGWGGDAYFVKKYAQAEEVIGIDFCEAAIQICQNASLLKDLQFQVGDAEALPFSDEIFDVIVNVESSHCYSDLRQFYREAYRVLKPGGAFLYADYFWDKNYRQYLQDAGFHINEAVDITKNVVRAAEEGYLLRKRFLEKKVPKYFMDEVLEWSGTKGTSMHRKFKKGTLSYERFVLTR